MPKLYMLIGVPAAGKSTWIEQQAFDSEDWVILSTDKYVEVAARAQGKTYSEVWMKEVNTAARIMKADLTMAIQDGVNLVWDQTNLSVKVRAKNLAQVPSNYEKVAVFFPTPPDAELARRLASRPGKTIPANIIMGMKSQLEMPTLAEGFDEIMIIN